MLLSIRGSVLAAGVAHVARVLPRHAASPDEAMVILEAGDHGLTLAGSDRQLAAYARLSASVVSQGRLAVSGPLVAAVARLVAAGEEVELVAEASRLRIRTAAGSWGVPRLDPDLGPRPARMPNTELGRVNSDTLRRALLGVLGATSSPAIPGLHGAVQAQLAERLVLAATDKYRLAVAELDWQPVLATDEVTLNIPGEALRIALDATKQGAETVIRVSETLVALTTAGLAVVAPLQDKYVPWSGADFPAAQMSSEVLVDRRQLESAVTGASALLAKDEPLTLVVSPDLLLLVGNSAVRESDAERSIPVKRHRGEPPEPRAVRPLWLGNALSAMTSTHVSVAIGHEASMPMVFRPANSDGRIDPEYRHVLMPIRMVGKSR
jgi:DNA polymerase III subunit beta